MLKEPSGRWLILTSRNGSLSSFSTSKVNWMVLSIVLLVGPCLLGLRGRGLDLKILVYMPRCRLLQKVWTSTSQLKNKMTRPGYVRGTEKK